MKIPDYRISKLESEVAGFGKCGTLRVIEHMRFKVSTRPNVMILTFKWKKGKLRIIKTWSNDNETE